MVVLLLLYTNEHVTYSPDDMLSTLRVGKKVCALSSVGNAGLLLALSLIQRYLNL